MSHPPNNASLSSWSPRFGGVGVNHPQSTPLQFPSRRICERNKMVVVLHAQVLGWFRFASHYTITEVPGMHEKRHAHNWKWTTVATVLFFFLNNGLYRAALTGLRTSGKVIQRGNTMGRTMRKVTCLRALDGQDRLRGWSSSSSVVSVACCRTRGWL